MLLDNLTQLHETDELLLIDLRKESRPVTNEVTNTRRGCDKSGAAPDVVLTDKARIAPGNLQLEMLVTLRTKPLRRV